MGVSVAGLSNDRKVPGTFLSVILGGAGTSSGAQTKKLLLGGNKITSAITNSAPSFTVAAGTQANAAPIAVTNADDAATYFGRGSELHLMAAEVFSQYPSAQLTCVSVAESGGSRATGVATFATTATAAFTVRVFLNGLTFDVAVASGDTATVIATAVATAILARPDLPVTAQFAVGALTITAKHTGPRGNALIMRMQFVPSSGAPVEITTSSTSSGAATTCTISGVTTVESTYQLSGGTTADDATAALAAVASTTYHRQVWATGDATNGALVSAQLTSMASVTSQRRQQAILASGGTLAAATTIATGLNAARMQLVWHYNSIVSPPQVAAQVAAARLFGNAQAGGSMLGELNRPSANLDGCTLVDIKEQPFPAEQPTDTELQSALANGLTPLIPSPARPGYAAIARPITTRSLANSQPNYAVLDTGSVCVPDDVADDLQSFLATQYAGVNLVSEPANDQPPLIDNTTTPSQIRSAIKTRLKLRESNGWIKNVDLHDAQLVVAENVDVPGRVDCEIPVVPVPGLHIIGGNVRQLTA